MKNNAVENHKKSKSSQHDRNILESMPIDDILAFLNRQGLTVVPNVLETKQEEETKDDTIYQNNHVDNSPSNDISPTSEHIDEGNNQYENNGEVSEGRRTPTSSEYEGDVDCNSVFSTPEGTIRDFLPTFSNTFMGSLCNVEHYSFGTPKPKNPLYNYCTQPTPPSAASGISTVVEHQSENDDTYFVSLVDDKSGDGTVQITFSEIRPHTVFGAKQGDHKISYEMFIRFCTRQITGCKIRNVPHVISAALSHVITDKVPTKTIEKLEAFQTRKKEIVNTETDKWKIDTLRKGIRAEEISIVQSYLNKLIKKYSAQPSVVHEKTGEKGGNEGSSISCAIASLQIIDEFNDLKSKLESNDNNKIIFAKQCLCLNGRLVRGMANILERISRKKTTIKDVRAYFKLPNNAKENDKRFNIALAQKLFEFLNEASQDANFIGGLIEKCFDFPKKQYNKNKKPKNATTIGAEGLADHSSKCIITSFGAFPSVNINGVIPAFINHVSENQKWNLTETKKAEVTQIIDQKLNEWILNKEQVLVNMQIDIREEVRSSHVKLGNCVVTKKRKKTELEQEMESEHKNKKSDNNPPITSERIDESSVNNRILSFSNIRHSQNIKGMNGKSEQPSVGSHAVGSHVGYYLTRSRAGTSCSKGI